MAFPSPNKWLITGVMENLAIAHGTTLVLNLDHLKRIRVATVPSAICATCPHSARKQIARPVHNHVLLTRFATAEGSQIMPKEEAGLNRWSDSASSEFFNVLREMGTEWMARARRFSGTFSTFRHLMVPRGSIAE